MPFGASLECVCQAAVESTFTPCCTGADSSADRRRRWERTRFSAKAKTCRRPLLKAGTYDRFRCLARQNPEGLYRPVLSTVSGLTHMKAADSPVPKAQHCMSNLVKRTSSEFEATNLEVTASARHLTVGEKICCSVSLCGVIMPQAANRISGGGLASENGEMFTIAAARGCKQRSRDLPQPATHAAAGTSQATLKCNVGRWRLILASEPGEDLVCSELMNKASIFARSRH